ncbi:hypothetical protein M409DRAFT_31077 [Zasmidium cellare ATCC 36951]|uniref:Zn(2)-C6 fungal-type domain-containing protein n=1 Tax=Zasmidium cellare ATCC 36951 TaxID=1080233 RepID=A0A6A6BV65_ZASCE|nr:uncharacterized protein M409DRAFT_31077 [Zasmidium cellare ATCC 36951]KAF2158413.1 hypothetical protein M409DRAFT_31077 [Zasmidium cellare ATCC 36951]
MAVRPPSARLNFVHHQSENWTTATENTRIAAEGEGVLYVHGAPIYRAIRRVNRVLDSPPHALPASHPRSTEGQPPAAAACPSRSSQLPYHPPPPHDRQAYNNHDHSGVVAPGLPAGPPLAHQMGHAPHHGYPHATGDLLRGLPTQPHQHQHRPSQPTWIAVETHVQCWPPPPIATSGPTFNANTSVANVGVTNPDLRAAQPYEHCRLRKPKKLRAAQACVPCRQRKRKCDEGSPCSCCKEDKFTCQYPGTPPGNTNATNATMEKLLRYAEAHSNELKKLNSKVDGFEQQSRRVEPNKSAAPEPTIMNDQDRPRRRQELEDHKTAPHKLLLHWPSVRKLLGKAKLEHDEGYVMTAEYGQDESDETGDTPPHAYGTWDTEMSSTPDNEARRSTRAGGLGSDGDVDLDAHTINELYDSYMRHIHILHPFLDQRELREMFDSFLRRYSTGGPRARFAVSTSDSYQRPLKRQRSNVSTANVAPQWEQAGEGEPTERSPGNAIIFLVLALGKICMHSDPLPGGDVIPGIAYYAKAAEILGDQGDGNDLVHAQMFLLAGLYKGQLAHVKESMSWITMAGRAIFILLDRYKLYNGNYWTAYGDVQRRHESAHKRIKDTRHSLIVLASWTCLQLESDIRADLKLPSSEIQSIEDLLIMPKKTREDEGRPDDCDNNLIYYTAQLFLRRRLNQVHREMYGPDCSSQSLTEVQEMLRGHENILTEWRRGLPLALRWNDNDPLSSDILAARLRAKYYGARYIVNRPFLDYALHIMPGLKSGHPMEAVARDGYGNPRDKADIHLFRAIEQLGDSTVREAARRCVDAAMHSTIAFDGVRERLILTNIHGTAHAQFGNMLALCATFTTDHMKQIVQTDEFRERLPRTISFLGKLAPISPTCAADCSILEKFNDLLFPIKQPDIEAADERCDSHAESITKSPS